jgi:hypothetical protein
LFASKLAEIKADSEILKLLESPSNPSMVSLKRLEAELGGEFDSTMSDEQAKKIVEETFGKMKNVLALNDMNYTDCFIDASSDGQSFLLNPSSFENALSSIYRPFSSVVVAMQETPLRTT